MKKTMILYTVLFCCIGVVLWIVYSPEEPIVDQKSSFPAMEASGEKQEEQAREFFSFREMSAAELVETLGAPVRKDPSEYGYEWWVYGSGEGVDKQFGIMDGLVVTGVLFQEEEGMIRIHDSYDQVEDDFAFQSSYRLDSEGAYTLKLSEKDITERPVISIDERWSAQLYFDNVDQEIFAVRMLRNDILLKHQPYKVIYRGSLPLKENWKETAWREIEDGMEAQVFSITNEVRKLHFKGSLSEHEGAALVAYDHSRDMDQNNYFSHYSRNGDGLKERLGSLTYVRAGENIATQYVDATAAVHGWLNSPGHRKALLDPHYTHLGVGVYHRYYTQNFLTVP